jgi:hypothetical protein
MYVVNTIGRRRERALWVKSFDSSANQVNPSVLHNVGGEGAQSNLLDRQPTSFALVLTTLARHCPTTLF